MVECRKNGVAPHFIYCYSLYLSDERFEKCKELIRNKMQEYGIRSSILTTLCMSRHNLITQEKSKQAAEGKLMNEQYWKHHNRSINDDLDSIVNDVQDLAKIVYEEVPSFLTSKLTKEELKLVDQKNQEYMMSFIREFDADIEVDELKKSDSKNKYVRCFCHRQTVHLIIEQEENL